MGPGCVIRGRESLVGGGVDQWLGIFIGFGCWVRVVVGVIGLARYLAALLLYEGSELDPLHF
jgi:hypothetical protein